MNDKIGVFRTFAVVLDHLGSDDTLKSFVSGLRLDFLLLYYFYNYVDSAILIREFDGV